MNWPDWVKRGLSAGLMAGMVAVVSFFEGYRETPYKDQAGVLTVCYGHTGADIQEKRRYTPLECQLILESDIEVAREVLRRRVKVELTTGQETALVSFVINFGETKFRKSALLKKLNKGDYVGACNELPRWNRAGGRVNDGLITRRGGERELCLGL